MQCYIIMVRGYSHVHPHTLIHITGAQDDTAFMRALDEFETETREQRNEKQMETDKEGVAETEVETEPEVQAGT